MCLIGHAEADIPLPRRRDIAIRALLDIEIEMAVLAEIQVRAKAKLPPAAAKITRSGSLMIIVPQPPA